MSLQTLRPLQGAAWVWQAFALFLRYPFGFLGLLCASLLLMVLLMSVPYLGVFLAALAIPWLSLGLMQASRGALAGKPPLVNVLFEPFQTKPSRLRPLLILGLSYLSVIVLVRLVSASFMDEAALAAIQKTMPTNPNDFHALTQNTHFRALLMLQLGLSTLLLTLFWHVAPLVCWGAQPVGRALVFNLIALWRNKMPFLVFSATWLLAGAGLAMACSLLVVVTGWHSLLPLLSLVLTLVLMIVFSISTYFSFAACFWQPNQAPPSPPEK